MPSPIMQMFDRRQTRDIAIASTNSKIKGTRRREGEKEGEGDGRQKGERLNRENEPPVGVVTRR